MKVNWRLCLWSRGGRCGSSKASVREGKGKADEGHYFRLSRPGCTL